MFRRIAALFGMVFATAMGQNQAAAVSSGPPGWACGDEGALTAVAQLPATRGIVFDPVSNSFAFVSCGDCANAASVRTNLDRLDRRRLALTTQKLVLLVMPYNPLDGSLTGETVSKLGVESEEIPLGGAPAAPAKGAAGGGNATSSVENLLDFRISGNPPKQPKAPPALPDAPHLLDWLRTQNQSVRTDLNAAQSQFAKVPPVADCMQNHVRDLPVAVSKVFADRARSFSLVQDRTVKAIEDEATARIAAAAGVVYQGCLASANGLDQDEAAVGQQISAALIEISRLGRELDQLDSVAQGLPDTPPKNSGYDASDWKAAVKRERDLITQDRGYLKDFTTAVNNAATEVSGTRAEHRAFRQAMTSPALTLQRREYPPLASGDGITFTFKRNAVLAADGKTELVPAAQAKLDVKSAPVSTIRFGTGVVVSELKDSTFKVGANQAGKPTIAFEDRGNGNVLPALFVHHYWGPRTGLLDPTPFERFMPTFSLGIPLAKSDPLQQVLIGLDWELITGLELNVGAHWGKVNGLAPGHTVGDEIPSGTDLTALQEKRFRAELYAGVVLNGDAFSRLFGARQSSK